MKGGGVEEADADRDWEEEEGKGDSQVVLSGTTVTPPSVPLLPLLHVM